MLKKYYYYYLIFLILLLNLKCTNVENNIISPNSVPSPPQNLSAKSGDKKIILMWNSPSSNGGLSLIEYIIYRGVTSGSYILIKHLSPDSLSYIDSDTTLVNGNNYFYIVTAKNNLGESGRSNEVIGIPSPDIVPPSAPLNFVGISGFGLIRLQWEVPVYNGGSPIINYKLYKGISENNLSLYRTLAESSNSYNDSDVINTSTYYYQITASNSIHEGDKSPIINIITSNVPSLISPIDNSTVSTLTPLLFWTNDLNSTGYHLQVSLTSSFTFQIVNVSGLVSSSYTIPNNLLNENISYYWRVRAFNTIDSSTWTSPFTFNVFLDTINPTNKVLIELFTNTSSIPCVEANQYLDNIFNLTGVTSNDANVVILRFHTPLFSGDPFYLFNTTDNNTRMAFYPNSAIVNPRTFLLGSFIGNFSSAAWTNKINEELAETRTYAIKLTNTYDSVSRNGNINFKIRQVSGVVLSDLVYHIVVAENNIIYNAPNGETQFNNTFRDFITPPTGEPFTINPGQIIGFNQSYTIDTQINQSKTDLVVFVQRNNNTGREVLAVEKVKLK